MSAGKMKAAFDLTGKTAVVTGGAGILGKEFCRGLAEFGAQVAIVDVNAEGVEATAEILRKDYSCKCLPVVADLTDPDSIRSMVDGVIGEFGSIDILHNNAAWKSDDLDGFYAPFEEYDYKIWRQVMAVNIDAMFLVAQAVGKEMLKNENGGSVIQTSSIYGVMGPDQRIYEGSEYMGRQISSPACYSVSKAAVLGLTQYLAAYWGDKGIRVNSISPGGVESGQNETFKSRYGARIPMGRMARSNEMVGALIFLASDASSYITGENIMIDGGLSAW
ncbi:MAG: SDR family oxidoreductase [Candidatus Nitrohelix vancouverensis]|uniref:SDR family oxidoreductase n=1 Tax=Candidatus Nitrohelix vancouverensis TaxID=2705534 RepID=A0A7T0C035_9BACT|nr:MAG: SDR family oxidoreductase [Candidatus Nitrohelix vancouverensis]